MCGKNKLKSSLQDTCAHYWFDGYNHWHGGLLGFNLYEVSALGPLLSSFRIYNNLFETFCDATLGSEVVINFDPFLFALHLTQHHHIGFEKSSW